MKQNTGTMNCNEEKAKELTKEVIEKKGGLKLNELQVDITEDSTYYTIEYLPKDTMMLGGGGKFKVSKSDCKIIEGELYQ